MNQQLMLQSLDTFVRFIKKVPAKSFDQVKEFKLLVESVVLIFWNLPEEPVLSKIAKKLTKVSKD